MRSPLESARITCDAPCHGYGATDWGANEGTPVYAMYSGTIDTYWLNGGGNTLDLHGQGLRAHYAHLRSYAVSDGATVREGELIAYSGNTGSLTTGPHLHVGLLDGNGNAVYVNGSIAGPYEYLNSIGYDWSNSNITKLEGIIMSTPTIVLHQSNDGKNAAFIVQRNFSERIFPANEVQHLCKVYGIDFGSIPSINDQDRDVMSRSFGADVSEFMRLIDSTLDDEQVELLTAIRTVQPDAPEYAPASDVAAAVEALLKDDFGAIPARVADESAARLKD